MKNEWDGGDIEYTVAGCAEVWMISEIELVGIFFKSVNFF